MKNIIILFALLFVTSGLFAQKFANVEFAADTLSNTETLSQVIAPNWVKKSPVAISVQLEVEDISGTTAGDVLVQTSNFASGDFWDTVFTWTPSGGVEDTTYTDDFVLFKRLRIYKAQTGTQVNAFNNAVIIIERE